MGCFINNLVYKEEDFSSLDTYQLLNAPPLTKQGIQF